MPAAKMEHGADESVIEQLHSEMTIKTEVEEAAQSSAHVDTKVRLPSLTSTRAIVGRTSVSADDVAQGQLLHTKEKLEDADLYIGPTELQHMDSHYRSHQMDLNAIKQESTIRLDAGEVLSGIKHRQELHSVVRYETIEDSQTDNNTVLCKYSSQITKEENYSQAHVKSFLGRQTDHDLLLQRQHRSVSSNGFKCEASDTTFLKPQLLSTHNKLHQQCSSNTSMTTSSTTLAPSNQRRDETATVKVKSFECDICAKRYSCNQGLYGHKRLHSGIGLSVCNICNAKFAQKSALTRHMIIHTEEKPYHCDTCYARFTYKSVLSDHMRIHTGEKPYHCDTCDARFARKSALTVHMRIHTGEKPYHCDTCDAKFAQKIHLNVHMRTHTGEKPTGDGGGPYHCDTCNARFSYKSVLSKHMRIHTGEKPYHCETCDARFTQRFTLSFHMKIHLGEKPYHCDTCDSRFALKSALTVHMRIHMGGRPMTATRAMQDLHKRLN